MTIGAGHFRLTLEKGPLIVDNQSSIKLDPKGESGIVNTRISHERKHLSNRQWTIHT